LKKNFVYGGQTRSKKNRFFPKKWRHLEPIRHFDFPKKVSSTKVRYQKYASNAEKDFEIGQKLCLWEQKYENKGFRRHFRFCGHFVELHNLWLIFLDATLDYQQICLKNLFLRSPLGLFQENI
jgi:hypothetical protein